MRVVFLIHRKNFYRVLGPVIDRALARGWRVECWHDWGQPRRGPKALEFPDTVPTFQHGRPRVRNFPDAATLAAWLTTEPPDAVIGLQFPRGAPRVAPTRWLGLQYTLNVAELLDGSGATSFDWLGLHTAYWRERTADALRIAAAVRAGASGAPPTPVDDAAVGATLAQRASLAGFPEMDQWHTIDRAAVRARLGLGDTRPIVLYLPFPFRSNPRTFWVRHVYGAPTRSWARLAVGLAGRPEYLPHVRAGWTDRAVVAAVRAFCDENGAALVVKSRAKDPVPGYLRRAADRVLGDTHHYPAAVLELLSVSALCVHCFSTAAYEAAYAHVPSICVAPPGEDLGFPPPWREWFLSTDEGSSFNFRGVVYALGLGQILGELAAARLADYPLDPVARAQYLEKFVGGDDGKSSERVLDAAQSPGGERSP
jgi:hypothetical protein